MVVVLELVVEDVAVEPGAAGGRGGGRLVDGRAGARVGGQRQRRHRRLLHRPDQNHHHAKPTIRSRTDSRDRSRPTRRLHVHCTRAHWQLNPPTKSTVSLRAQQRLQLPERWKAAAAAAAVVCIYAPAGRLPEGSSIATRLLLIPACMRPCAVKLTFVSVKQIFTDDDQQVSLMIRRRDNRFWMNESLLWSKSRWGARREFKNEDFFSFLCEPADFFDRDAYFLLETSILTF